MKRILIGLVLCSLLLCPFTIFAAGTQEVFSGMGAQYQHTVLLTSTNSSQLLTTALDTALATTLDYTKVKSVLITCETADVRIAFGASAAISPAVGHVLAAGNSFRIPSSSMIRGARFISKTTSTPGTLQVTLEY